MPKPTIYPAGSVIRPFVPVTQSEDGFIRPIIPVAINPNGDYQALQVDADGNLLTTGALATPIAAGPSGTTEDLPDATIAAGLYIYIKTDASAQGPTGSYVALVNPINGQTINGVEGSYYLMNQNQYVVLLPYGGGWLIVGNN